MATARRPLLLRAPWILVDSGRSGVFRRGGGLLLQGGEVKRVLGSEGAVRRSASASGLRPRDAGGVLLPGLVNAHAHLELLPVPWNRGSKGDFVSWVESVVRSIARIGSARRRVALESAAARCLETGTTTVGDIDSTGVHTGGLALRRVVYREALDAADGDRTEAALSRIRRRLPPRVLRTEGVSPHAPHTVSRPLAHALGTIARRRSIPLSIHWAESEEEVRYLRDGSGPFASRLGPSPHTNGLELLARAGLLTRRTALIHGNRPQRGDASRIARAGCTLVHCPGTHAFFGREPFPRERYRREGVKIALGTDSLASNSDLDLRREMALYRTAFPGVSAAEAFEAATRQAARALDLPKVGRIARGCQADLVAHVFSSTRSRDFLEELTLGGGEIAGVWVRGRRWQPGGID